MAKESKVALFTRLVAEQKQSIDKLGGTLTAYIELYGDPDVPTREGKKMFGNGGTAIWEADNAALRRYEGLLDAAQREVRTRHVR